MLKPSLNITDASLELQGVEAKLILLSQGGAAASRLASALVCRRISMGEPQQVAPRTAPSAPSGPSEHGHARRLSEQPENVATLSSDAQKVQLPGVREGKGRSDTGRTTHFGYSI